ncbi:thiamine pyrophosphate-binding protein, partial [Nonomuraea fuscirosea]
MIVAEAVGRVLAACGAGTAFGVVGSGNFHVTNALVAAGVPFVAARHEGGAATMADAYARMSGRAGIVSVHQGPGLTNAMTGITEAAKSRTPLIVLAGEATEPQSNFHIDQSALAVAVGAVAMRVTGAGDVVERVVRAYRVAVGDRRTVLLNLPLDVQSTPCPDLDPTTLTARTTRLLTAAPPSAGPSASTATGSTPTPAGRSSGEPAGGAGSGREPSPSTGVPSAEDGLL